MNWLISVHSCHRLAASPSSRLPFRMNIVRQSLHSNYPLLWLWPQNKVQWNDVLSIFRSSGSHHSWLPIHCCSSVIVRSDVSPPMAVAQVDNDPKLDKRLYNNRRWSAFSFVGVCGTVNIEQWSNCFGRFCVSDDHRQLWRFSINRTLLVNVDVANSLINGGL